MYKDTNCGEPRESTVGSLITVAGWVHRRRDHGNLIFIDLRDRSGLLQVVFNPEYSEAAHELAGSLRSEWVVQITGKIVRRLPGAENPELPTGTVELSATKIVVLNKSLTPPFEVSDDIDVDDNTRLKYRFIDLRRPKMQAMLKLRHRVTHIMWDFLTENGFTQIETPILLKSTPEGARDYVVPSRVHPGQFYALPQSPQQLKQLLMVSGVERYFQIARSFRDEDLRADRQPEFTQLDFEMSFVHQDDVMAIVEELYLKIFHELLPDATVSDPFIRLSYTESMERFGTDKPDLRFGMELTTITETAATSDARVFQAVASSGGTIRGFVAPGCGNYGRRDTDRLTDFAKSSGAQGLVFIALDESAPSIDALEDDHIKSPLKKFLSIDIVKQLANETGAKPGDLMLIVAGTYRLVNTVLSNLRNEMARRLELVDENNVSLAWIYDFPLFEWDDDLNKWEPAHHVFSSPKAEHMQYLDTDPGKVLADLYDLVCNGQEMGSGSIRIHDKDIQTRVFGVIDYGEDEIQDRFGQLLTAFTYGAPPHGGMGLGLDRLVAILAGEQAIREVIAFPKTQSAVDPLFEAPAIITDQQLEELHIRVVMPEN
ncbi:MAG TPA: aspartate--tRNA ligase [Dehalococcoidia bacterium]|nr:aspartate--tRNA ligase [Dehalococcoidia bacterium]